MRVSEPSVIGHRMVHNRLSDDRSAVGHRTVCGGVESFSLLRRRVDRSHVDDDRLSAICRGLRVGPRSRLSGGTSSSRRNCRVASVSTGPPKCP